MAVEWETEPVPADRKGGPLTFVWLAGHATGKGAHRFDLAVDGREALSFRTSADSSRREWRETGPDGISLTFKTVMVDQFDELFGFMWLEVPAAARPSGPAVEDPGHGRKSRLERLVHGLPRRSAPRRLGPGRAGPGPQGRPALPDRPGRGQSPRRARGARSSRAARPPRPGSSSSSATTPSSSFCRPSTGTKPVTIEVALDDGSVRRGELTVKPVVPREIWLLPHSHVDIGYSDPQPVVERNHWRYFREAIALAGKTADYPEGARFKWNTEQAWAVETYLRQAGEAEKAAFLEAMRRGIDRAAGHPGRCPDRPLPSRGILPADRVRPGARRVGPGRPWTRSWSPTSRASPGPSCRPWPWPGSSTSRAGRTTCRACSTAGTGSAGRSKPGATSPSTGSRRRAGRGSSSGWPAGATPGSTASTWAPWSRPRPTGSSSTWTSWPGRAIPTRWSRCGTRSAATTARRTRTWPIRSGAGTRSTPRRGSSSPRLRRCSPSSSGATARPSRRSGATSPATGRTERRRPRKKRP